MFFVCTKAPDRVRAAQERILVLRLGVGLQLLDTSLPDGKTQQSHIVLSDLILESDIYNGEIYDARLEMSDWDKSRFDDKNWKPVSTKNYELNNIVASVGPPVKKIEEIKSIKIIYAPNRA